MLHKIQEVENRHHNNQSHYQNLLNTTRPQRVSEVDRSFESFQQMRARSQSNKKRHPYPEERQAFNNTDKIKIDDIFQTGRDYVGQSTSNYINEDISNNCNGAAFENQTQQAQTN